eukprot:COSAG04_NODE_22478_length_354_cov_0.811765_1_plen_82_part_00
MVAEHQKTWRRWLIRSPLRWRGHGPVLAREGKGQRPAAVCFWASRAAKMLRLLQLSLAPAPSGSPRFRQLQSLVGKRRAKC